MNPWLRGLCYILTSYAIAVILRVALKEGSRSYIKNKDNNHIILRMPKILKIIIAVCMILFSGGALGAFYADQVGAGCFFLAFVIFAAALLSSLLSWKIEAFADRDYFIWRTSFGRKYTVKYSDCINYGYTHSNELNDALELMWGKKKIRIPYYALNFAVFMRFLHLKGVKHSKNKESNSKRLAWMRDKVHSVSTVVFTIAFTSVMFLIFGIFFLVVVLTYDKIEPGADVFLYVMAVFCFVSALIYGVGCPLLIKVYPKYKKLTHLLLKKGLFRGIPLGAVNAKRKH